MINRVDDPSIKVLDSDITSIELLFRKHNNRVGDGKGITDSPVIEDETLSDTSGLVASKYSSDESSPGRFATSVVRPSNPSSCAMSLSWSTIGKVILCKPVE